MTRLLRSVIGLKNLAPAFQPMKTKANTNGTFCAQLFCPCTDQVTATCYESQLVHRAVCSFSDNVGSGRPVSLA